METYSLPFEFTQSCAIKVESCNSNKQVLKMEVAVLKRLQNSSAHICEFIGCGRNSKVNYVVMALLGPNLSELRKHQPNQKFSISTTLRVGIQIIEAVQSMHDCGFLHRDIKPSNFSIGDTPESSRTCYMFDYGLARQYTTVTGEVRQPRPVAGFRGTVRYASLNAHLSRDLGRHDDLWSVFYLLIELASGHLPWRKIRDKEEAGEYKAQYDHKKLTKGLPIELNEFLNHLKSCSYFDKPDYALLTRSLQDAMSRLSIHDSDPYDWEQDFSVPSMTTASMVSAPAVKLMNEEKGPDIPSPMRTPSKTNCSGVADLSDGHSVYPTDEKRDYLTVPRPDMKNIPSNSHQSHDYQQQDMKDYNLKARESPIGESSESESKQYQVAMLPNKGIMLEKLKINKYVSEDDNDDYKAVSDKEHSHLDVVTHSHKELSTNSEKMEHRSRRGSGGTPMKSYQTESLNRFYDYGSNNPVKDTNESYRSLSKKSANEDKAESNNVSSKYFSKKYDKSRSSNESDVLNNAVIYPRNPNGDDRLNAFEFIKENELTKKIQDKKRQITDDENSHSGVIKCKSKEMMKPFQESSIDSPESDSAHSSDEPLQKLLVHQLLVNSSRSESESTKSIEMLFAQKTLNTDFTNFLASEQSKNVALSESNRVDDQRRNVTEHGPAALLHPEDDMVRKSKGTPSVVKSDQLQPTTHASLSEHAGRKPLSDQHKQVPAVVDEQSTVTSSSGERQTKSAKNLLEVSPKTIRIHPRPPPNPPPLNYSMSLLARRRRFVRSKSQSKS